jgi:CubicO group peptidase (beta-lactamase class C family)
MMGLEELRLWLGSSHLRRLGLTSWLFLLVWIPLLGQANPGLGRLEPAIEKIDHMTALALTKRGVGSITLGVVSGDQLVWTRSYGYADHEAGRLANRESVYRIGSITKQFTAHMLLQLVERGKVRLSDRVEKHLPEVNQVQGRFEDAAPITLVQLATMTSGLAREPEDLPTYLVGPVSRWEEVMLSALPRVKYDFEPDTGYQYCNIGYAMLGAALGRAAGQPFVDWVTEQILQPLEMPNTAFEPNPTIQAHITKGYAIGSDGQIDAETPARQHEGRGYKVPNGALYTSVDDLAKFVSYQLGHGPESVLSKKTLEHNFSQVNTASDDLSTGYGIGFRVVRRGDSVFYGHGGGVSGYTVSSLFERGTQLGMIVLTNAGGRLNPAELASDALAKLVAAKKGKDRHHR